RSSWAGSILTLTFSGVGSSVSANEEWGVFSPLVFAIGGILGWLLWRVVGEGDSFFGGVAAVVCVKEGVCARSWLCGVVEGGCVDAVGAVARNSLLASIL